MSRPLFAAPLAVSMGDPAGIGPEIVVKTWAARAASDPAFFVIGDPAVYARAFARLGLPATIAEIAAPSAAGFPPALPVLPMPFAAP